MSPHRSRSLRFCLSYAWVILWLAGSMPARAAAEVAVVVSEDSAPYREVVEALRGGLVFDPAAPRSVRILSADALDGLRPPEPAVVVTVGARATRAVAMSELHAPLLATLLPRKAYERIAEESGRRSEARFSAVFLDQPPARQLDLIRLALPGAVRVGLLLGPESEPLLGAMQAGGASRRMRIAAQTLGGDNPLFPALQKLLAEADVLLALPDSTVFNGATIPNILLATYRLGLPVVGFSAAYTRAGAVLALYSTPQQIGAQAAEMLRYYFSRGALPPPQYPRDFVVSANPHVASSLGLALDDATVLEQRLREAEGRRDLR